MDLQRITKQLSADMKILSEAIAALEKMAAGRRQKSMGGERKRPVSKRMKTKK
jgi:hypothetical protein